MKKILLYIISLVMVFPTALVSAVTEADELKTRSESEILIDLEDSMSSISSVIKTIPNIDSATAASLSSNFAEFMKYAGYAGTVLGLVNGSVAFLRMIGVIKDPTATKLNQISDQIAVINDKINEMDTKLNDLTSAMSKLEALSEFHERDRKSDYLLKNWKDFTDNYMESTLDVTMSEFNAMILNGTSKWFKNEGRSDGDVDTSKVIVLYKKEGNTYTPYQTYLNEVPNGFPSDSRYIIIESSALPGEINWDVNNYRNTLQSEISSKIYNAVSRKDFTGIKVQNYPFLTKEGAPQYIDQGPQLEIKKIAEEVTDALLYRITAKEVNKDANYTTKILQQFSQYTDHLKRSDEGVDAVIKSMFLTHAFEPEVREDLTNFTNFMMVKTGVYGTFVTNVLGMSKFASDTDKLTVLDDFGKAVKYVKNARDNGITGNDRYSYITNTELDMIYTYVRGGETLEVRVGPGERRAYKGFSSTDLKLDCPFEFPGKKVGAVGTVPAMVLMNTLTANGYTPNFDGLRKFFGNFSAYSGGIIVSHKTPEDMAMDGSIAMNVKNVSGDYFSTGQSTNKLQGDAELQYVVKKQKMLGDVYFPESGKLESNFVLGAIGAYAEEHTMWFTDETAVFGGPRTVSTFSDGLSSSGSDPTRFDYTISAQYNYLVAVIPDEQIQMALLGTSNTSDEYDPIESFKNIDLTDLGEEKTDEAKNRAIGIALVTVFAMAAVTTTVFVIVSNIRKPKEEIAAFEDEESE